MQTVQRSVQSKFVFFYCIKDRHSDRADEHSPRLVVSHPFSQTDESLMSGVDRQAVPVHQDALMTFSEVQGPETPRHIKTWKQSD